MENTAKEPVYVPYDTSIGESITTPELGFNGTQTVVLPTFLAKLEEALREKKLPEEIEVTVQGTTYVIEMGTVTPPVTLEIPSRRDSFAEAVETWDAKVQGAAFFDLYNHVHFASMPLKKVREDGKS